MAVVRKIEYQGADTHAKSGRIRAWTAVILSNALRVSSLQ